jgi:uncharacterized phiE125 gp8 family phage protein
MTIIRRERTWPGIPWDDGITWFTRRTVAPASLPVDVSFFCEAVLRTIGTGNEYTVVESYLTAATEAAEHETQRALVTQTWEMVLSGFPASGRVVLERPPMIEIASVSYYDSDGETQELAVSPADFDTVPSGAYSKAEIRPLDGETFPSTATRGDAVTITYTAGYSSTTDPTLALINAGIYLMAGELYKQRTLSVHAVHNTPALLDLKRFWRQVR